MHELSIAQSILDTVVEERTRRALDKVDRIVVRIGALSGVLPDALQFSFEAIRIDTPLAETELAIETIPIGVECRDCASRTTVEDFLFVCPACESVHVDVVSGYELDIAYIEVPDAVATPANT